MDGLQKLLLYINLQLIFEKHILEENCCKSSSYIDTNTKYNIDFFCFLRYPTIKRLLAITTTTIFSGTAK